MIALVPAAGGGRRFGGEAPKQYALLAGRAVLARTLDRLAAALSPLTVIVALAPDDDYYDAVIGERKGVAHPEARSEPGLRGQRVGGVADHDGAGHPPGLAPAHLQGLPVDEFGAVGHALERRLRLRQELQHRGTEAPQGHVAEHGRFPLRLSTIRVDRRDPYRPETAGNGSAGELVLKREFVG